MNAEQILVLILAIALAVFLLEAIVFMVFLIKVIINIRRITDKAQSVSESLEAVAEAFRKSTKPMAISGVIISALARVLKHKKGGKK